MATEIISADLTEPYLADAGDLIRVLEGVTVGSIDTAGIMPRTATDNDVRIVVAGTVIGEYYGVSLDGYVEPVPGEREGGNSLLITETGRVTGVTPISSGYGRGNRIVNEGLIDASFGIIGEGDETRIVNRGTMEMTVGAMSQQGNGSSVLNEGLIKGWLYFAFGSGIRFANAGVVESAGGSVVVTSANDFTMVNRGRMTDDLPGIDGSFAFYADFCENVRIVNSGIMEGYYGMHLVTIDGIIRNSGTIDGSRSGLYVDGSWNEGLRIINSGVISGDYSAIEVSDGVPGDLSIRNTGTIGGDVNLGDRADTYTARHSGEVLGQVRGGGGNDILIGAGAEDHFDGGAGDDHLNGRRRADVLAGQEGNDTLRGGRGHDRLDGGADADLLDGEQGDDRLTGGAGADVFAFGADAGQDRVTDFEAGTDILRLTGHSGGFAALAISDRNAHLEILHDGGIVVLERQAGLVLTSADFDFV